MIASPKQNKLEQKMWQNEQVYLRACEVFGGSPRVFRYYDQSDEISMDLLTAPDSPHPQVVSYSTLGLQHHSVGMRSDGMPLRVEIAAAGYETFEYHPNLLSACAFDIMNAHFACCDGAVYRDCVNTYVPGSAMKHLLFTSRSLWAKPLDPFVFSDKKTVWLTAIPISEGELAFLEEKGPAALLAALEEAATDFFDLKRPSLFPLEE